MESGSKYTDDIVILSRELVFRFHSHALDNWHLYHFLETSIRCIKPPACLSHGYFAKICKIVVSADASLHKRSSLYSGTLSYLT